MASVETAITVRTMNKPTAMRDSCWRCINTGMVLPVNDPITNRQAIERAIAVIYRVQHDTAITPTRYGHLQSAIGALREAARSPLDEQELDADDRLRDATPTVPPAQLGRTA
jgi:hypothetical protein